MSDTPEAFAVRAGPQLRAGIRPASSPMSRRLGLFARLKPAPAAPLRMRTFAADLDLGALQPQPLESHGAAPLASIDRDRAVATGFRAEPPRWTTTAETVTAVAAAMPAPAESTEPVSVPRLATSSPDPRMPGLSLDSRQEKDFELLTTGAATSTSPKTNIEFAAPPAKHPQRVGTSATPIETRSVGDSAPLEVATAGAASSIPTEGVRTEVSRERGLSMFPAALPADLADPRRIAIEPQAKVAPMGVAPLRVDAPDVDSTTAVVSPVLERLTQIREQASSSSAVRIGSVQVVVRAQPEPPRASTPVAPPSPSVAAAPVKAHRNLWLSRRRYE